MLPSGRPISRRGALRSYVIVRFVIYQDLYGKRLKAVLGNASL
jgi:hypothetical protein